MGLGLALAKDFLRKIGGKLPIAKAKGEGTYVRIALQEGCFYALFNSYETGGLDIVIPLQAI